MLKSHVLCRVPTLLVWAGLCASGLCLDGLCPAKADVEVQINGVKQTVRSAPVDPFLVIDSADKLRNNYEKVKQFLPLAPFQINNYWVVNPTDAVMRAFPEMEHFPNYPSAQGEYMVVISPRHSEEIPRYSKRIDFNRQGKLLWQKENGPVAALVTETGTVIGRSPEDEPLSLQFFAADGHLITEIPSVFTPGQRMPYRGHLRLLPAQQLLLAWEEREVVTINYGGQVQWRYALPAEIRFARIIEPDIDPLGRGIYVPIQYEKDSSVELLNVKDGTSNGAIWQHKLFPLPLHLSPKGQLAAVNHRQRFGLVNWQNGESLFLRGSNDVIDLLDGKRLVVEANAMAGASDAPPCLVIPLAGDLGTSVFNAAGRRIWSCNIAWDAKDVRSRYLLSADSKTLAIMLESAADEGKRKIFTLLLYNVDPVNSTP